jgi:hypothetical protein
MLEENFDGKETGAVRLGKTNRLRRILNRDIMKISAYPSCRVGNMPRTF